MWWGGGEEKEGGRKREREGGKEKEREPKTVPRMFSSGDRHIAQDLVICAVVS